MSEPNERIAARCASQHFGLWLVETRWFAEALAAVQAGVYVEAGAYPIATTTEAESHYEVDGSGVAAIPIHDFMTKYGSSFGGVSTLRTRRTIREAVQDDTVKAILLHVDSPGGTVAGTAELADDVRAANETKPVYAYIEDLGASAAYWVASQARRIGANTMAEIGSIGTVAVVDDTSGRYEAAGVKVHVISTGAHKGAFVDGAPITEEHLAELQILVDDLNEHFLNGIKRGRGMPIAQVRTLADGRTWIASKAAGLGLIDTVEPLDRFVGEIHKAIGPVAAPRRSRATRLIRLSQLET